MTRFTIHPEVKNLPYNAAEGPVGFGVIAKAMVREDPEGAWVHFDEAEAAIKLAAETSGSVSLRQRYKLAAIHAVMVTLARVSETTLEKFRPKDTAKYCGNIADAMLAEDEEHAKK